MMSRQLSFDKPLFEGSKEDNFIFNKLEAIQRQGKYIGDRLLSFDDGSKTFRFGMNAFSNSLFTIGTVMYVYSRRIYRHSNKSLDDLTTVNLSYVPSERTLSHLIELVSEMANTLKLAPVKGSFNKLMIEEAVDSLRKSEKMLRSGKNKR